MSTEESNTDLYRKAAQMLLEYDVDMVLGHGVGVEDARQTARKLYERHGPFELNFTGNPPVWYDD